MNADIEVMRFFPAGLNFAESRRFMDHLANQADKGMTFWPIELPGKQDFIGIAGLEPLNFEAPFGPAVEVGWRLARAYWGQGYATEAGQASLNYGFQEVGLAEIVSFTAESNQRSIHVMQRLGMRYDGIFEHPKLVMGHALRSHVLFRLGRPPGQGPINSGSQG